MGNIARRRRRALELLAAQQAAEQLEPEAITQDVRIATKGGRSALRETRSGSSVVLPLFCRALATER